MILNFVHIALHGVYGPCFETSLFLHPLYITSQCSGSTDVSDYVLLVVTDMRMSLTYFFTYFLHALFL